jgi:hypothetical protein
MLRQLFWGARMARLPWGERIRELSEEAWRSVQLMCVFVVAALVFSTPPDAGYGPQIDQSITLGPGTAPVLLAAPQAPKIDEATLAEPFAQR